MCATAFDDPDPERGIKAGLYYGGHEYLAKALGLAWPEGDGPASAATRAGSLRNVRRIIADLEEAKAIEVADPARKVAPGTSQAYRILVDQGSFPPGGGSP